jgi:hypothetical protein
MRDTTVRDTTMRVAGRVGAGMQVGQPGGVVAKWYRSPPVAYTALLTTDGDDYASLIVNRLWEGPLRNSPLGAFVGPGLLVGSTGLQRQGAFALGVNGLAGLNFYVEPFEVFLQVTSRFRFLPNREDDVGGTVGMRLYL